jgi:3-oxoacyl-[acyl-carrier-protein] synthase-3
MKVRIEDRIYAGITGLGKYFPERVVDNHYMESIVDTSDQWIVERTGIHERRFAEPGTPASALSLPAARQALEMAQVEPDQVDCIIVCTITPDHLFPSTACTLQEQLGATRAWAFDLSGACSGWVYGLAIADNLIRSGTHERVLVVGADVMTSILDMRDRNTCVLFGDGAGAALLERLPAGQAGILGHVLGADGSGGKYLYMTAGGSAKPASHETVERREHFVVQEGKPVFKAAVAGMAQITVDLLDHLGLTGADVDLFVPHQANLRIIEAARRRADLAPETVMITIDRFGNTTAGTIPTSLRMAAEEGRVKEGDLVLVSTFGAGFTWGASAFLWTAKPI